MVKGKKRTKRKEMARKEARTAGLLAKIWSDRKRLEVIEVLSSTNPPHFRKVWLVGFLRYAVGLTEEEVFQLIMAAANWEKKDPKITRYQIASVKKEGASQGAVRRKNVENPVGRRPTFSSPGIWKGIMNGAGFILEWRRE